MLWVLKRTVLMFQVTGKKKIHKFTRKKFHYLDLWTCYINKEIVISFWLKNFNRGETVSKLADICIISLCHPVYVFYGNFQIGTHCTHSFYFRIFKV